VALLTLHRTLETSDEVTTSGFTYYLEYTTNPTAPTWNAAAQTPGNGTIKTLTDTTATDSRRFYQTHVQ
jgi:hypothetical protein